MQTLGQYGNAGSGLVAAKNDAAAGMRGLRESLWKGAYDARQRQGDRGMRNAAKDRRTQVFASLLGAAGQMPWASMLGGGSSIPQGALMGHDIHQPPPVFQNPYRTDPYRTMNA